MSLPNWNGAGGAYRRAYRILAGMARNGHVTRGHRQCFVSQDMRDFITALDSGDEEQVKFNNLNWAHELKTGE